jgi:hypothetical protein
LSLQRFLKRCADFIWTFLEALWGYFNCNSTYVRFDSKTDDTFQLKPESAFGFRECDGLIELSLEGSAFSADPQQICLL